MDSSQKRLPPPPRRDGDARATSSWSSRALKAKQDIDVSVKREDGRSGVQNQSEGRKEEYTEGCQWDYGGTRPVARCHSR